MNSNPQTVNDVLMQLQTGLQQAGPDTIMWALAGTFGLACLLLLARRLMSDVAAERQNHEAPSEHREARLPEWQQAYQAQQSTITLLANRLRHSEERIALLQQQLNWHATQQECPQRWDDAIERADKGAMGTDLVYACGLSEGEAQLVSSIYGRH